MGEPPRDNLIEAAKKGLVYGSASLACPVFERITHQCQSIGSLTKEVCQISSALLGSIDTRMKTRLFSATIHLASLTYKRLHSAIGLLGHKPQACGSSLRLWRETGWSRGRHGA